MAVAKANSPEEGLRLLDGLERRGELSDYHLLPAARAELLARLGRRQEAIEANRRALELVSIEPERQFLQLKLARAQRQTDVAGPRGEKSTPSGRS